MQRAMHLGRLRPAAVAAALGQGGGGEAAIGAVGTVQQAPCEAARGAESEEAGGVRQPEHRRYQLPRGIIILNIARQYMQEIDNTCRK